MLSSIDFSNSLHYGKLSDVLKNFFRRIIGIALEAPVVLTTQALVIALKFLDFMLSAFRMKETSQSKVAIEAGLRGWDSIFFAELLSSAEEFFGIENVMKLTIFPNEDRIKQLSIAISGKGVRLLIYDPRTNSRNSIHDLYEAFRVFVYCRLRRIRVIVYLTDPSITLWRLQSVIASRAEGRIITPMKSKELGWLAWGIKISGPFPMPISARTSQFIRKLVSESIGHFDGFKNPTFRGSLYSPRLAFFEKLNTLLEQKGSPIRVILKSKDEKSISAKDYWKGLTDNNVCVTTTFQVVPKGVHVDRQSINQMVFRISEALAAGNLLFSSPCPGLEEFFQEGKHYIEYSDEENLANKIVFYSSNVNESSKIRLEGYKQMSKLISEQLFWREITKVV